MQNWKKACIQYVIKEAIFFFFFLWEAFYKSSCICEDASSVKLALFKLS